MTDSSIPFLTTASKRQRWLVGVSGGADSVALLLLLLDAGFKNLVVCHLDHGLRGKASTADAKFVAKLAAKQNLQCEIGRVKIKADKTSLETEAREARHQFFATCAKKHHCPRIVLAHHADDQAETVLWNLLRGSHGLKGMRAVHEIDVDGTRLQLHRPLLAVRRCDLVSWLQKRHIAWREDATNAEPIAIRNRLRNEAIPLLESIAGRGVSEKISQALSGTQELEEIESWAIEKANALDPQGRLHVRVVRELPPALQQAVILRFLKDAGIGDINRTLVTRVTGLLDPTSPPAVNLPGGATIRRREARLFIIRP